MDTSVINRYDSLAKAVDAVGPTPIYKVAEREYGVGQADAPQALDALLQWMAAAPTRYPDKKRSFQMLEGDVDNMWHSFLLNTKQYRSVCDEVLGGYFDHTPSLDDNESKEAEDDIKWTIERLTSSYGDSLNPLLQRWAEADRSDSGQFPCMSMCNKKD